MNPINLQLHPYLEVDGIRFEEKDLLKTGKNLYGVTELWRTDGTLSRCYAIRAVNVELYGLEPTLVWQYDIDIPDTKVETLYHSNYALNIILSSSDGKLIVCMIDSRYSVPDPEVKITHTDIDTDCF
jgi:hypothetical protein